MFGLVDFSQFQLFLVEKITARIRKYLTRTYKKAEKKKVTLKQCRKCLSFMLLSSRCFETGAMSACIRWSACTPVKLQPPLYYFLLGTINNHSGFFGGIALAFEGGRSDTVEETAQKQYRLASFGAEKRFLTYLESCTTWGRGWADWNPSTHPTTTTSLWRPNLSAMRIFCDSGVRLRG